MKTLSMLLLVGFVASSALTCCAFAEKKEGPVERTFDRANHEINSGLDTGVHAVNHGVRKGIHVSRKEGDKAADATWHRYQKLKTKAHRRLHASHKQTSSKE